MSYLFHFYCYVLVTTANKFFIGFWHWLICATLSRALRLIHWSTLLSWVLAPVDDHSLVQQQFVFFAIFYICRQNSPHPPLVLAYLQWVAPSSGWGEFCSPFQHNHYKKLCNTSQFTQETTTCTIWVRHESLFGPDQPTTANMTARCALKTFESPWVRPRLLLPKF